MFLLGALLMFIASMMVKGHSYEKVVDGAIVMGSPGAGLLVVLLVFGASAVFGVYGAIRPQPRPG